MLELINLEQREYCLQNSLEELENINLKLSKLMLRKEELTREIIAAFGHEKDGQSTYQYARWRVEIKTPFIYALDKKKYASQEFNIPSQYNPIKESITYTLDKKRCEECIENAPPAVREALIELIEIKPGKPSVTLKGLV